MTWRLSFVNNTSIATPYAPKLATSATVEVWFSTSSGLERSLLSVGAPFEMIKRTTGALGSTLFGTTTNSTGLATLSQPNRGAIYWPGTATPGRLELNAGSDAAGKGGTDTTGTMTIGLAFSGAANWSGQIWDVRVYDGDFGTILHHWPIDDNVPDGGVIQDHVSGFDATLTLGAGVWVWVPQHFGITRPILRDVIRPITRLGIAGPGT